jgi:hypothetical protein
MCIYGCTCVGAYERTYVRMYEYVCMYVCTSIMYVCIFLFIEHAPLLTVVLHAVFQTMYIFLIVWLVIVIEHPVARFQSLLIQQTH